jgi:hypothetical protein
MPGFNRKGPQGEGAMSGRAMGKCTNYGANQRTKNLTDESQKSEPTPQQAVTEVQNPSNQFGQSQAQGNGGLGLGRGNQQGQHLGRGNGGYGGGHQHRNRFNNQ